MVYFTELNDEVHVFGHHDRVIIQTNTAKLCIATRIVFSLCNSQWMTQAATNSTTKSKKKLSSKKKLLYTLNVPVPEYYLQPPRPLPDPIIREIKHLSQMSIIFTAN